jgi:hypothetical protein
MNDYPVSAFFPGPLSFFLFMFAGEALGSLAMFILIAVPFFICQFHVSCGNRVAYRRD